MEYRFCEKCRKELIANGDIPTNDEIDNNVNYLSNEKDGLLEALNTNSESLQNIELSSKTLLWHFIDIFGLDIRKSELKAEILSLRKDIYEREERVNEIDKEITYNLALKKRNIREASIRYKNRMQLEEQIKQNIIEKRKRGVEQIIGIINYQRADFVIRNADYKRGNSLDNFIRNEMFESISEIFENRCVSCSCLNNLTLDHFWLSKNEGGNFVMLHKDTKTIVSNVIVLCRSCNSAKGDRSYTDFFTEEQIANIHCFHNRLSIFFQNDIATCRKASKWYGFRVRLLNGDVAIIDQKEKKDEKMGR